MKTKKEETTLVQRACTNVAGFKSAYKRLEKKIIISGKSHSTLNNYMRCIAHVSLHFSCLPTQLDLEQIEEYLLHLKKKGASEADFKLTVTGFGLCSVQKDLTIVLLSYLLFSETKSFR